MANMPTWRKESPTRGLMPRNGGTDNHTTISISDDMKRVLKEILKQKRLVPIAEEQPRRKSPFTENIMGKPLPRKFKMPQITPYISKDDLDDRIQNYESLMTLYYWDGKIMCRALLLTLIRHPNLVQ